MESKSAPIADIYGPTQPKTRSNSGGSDGMTTPNQNTETALTIAAKDSSLSMLAVIDRAARDPNVDVAKMERLLALAEQIHAREAKALYDQAMNAAQGEMRSISKDCHNPQTRSRYASYEAIDTAIRPIYTSHGFAMSFGSRAASSSDKVIVTCRVSHRGGHTEPVELEMPTDGKGAQGGNVMSRTHATGSALSYAKRYIANLVWNLSFGDVEDDGNAAGQRPPSYRTQPNKTPENPVSAPRRASSEDVVPKKATEATRKWMFDALKEKFIDSEITAFMQGRWDVSKWDKWPIEFVPTSRPQLGQLVHDIEQWLEGAEPPPGMPPNGDEPDFSEPFWEKPITIPRKGSKRAEYLKNPDTIRSLYEASKTDEFARQRLFGLVEHFEPKEWEGQGGRMNPPSKEDVECRANLDAFSAWHQEKNSQMDLIP